MRLTLRSPEKLTGSHSDQQSPLSETIVSGYVLNTHPSLTKGTDVIKPVYVDNDVQYVDNCVSSAISIRG